MKELIRHGRRGQKTRGAGVLLLLVCEWVGGCFVVKNQGLKSTQELEGRGQGGKLELSRCSLLLPMTRLS
ncbi:hypothetical protein PAMP_010229 [Pampus punctatissimus]